MSVTYRDLRSHRHPALTVLPQLLSTLKVVVFSSKKSCLKRTGAGGKELGAYVLHMLGALGPEARHRLLLNGT